MFAEHDIVKVVKLNNPDRYYSGSKNVLRPPRIGDTGTIVNILEVNKAFIVEMVAPDGKAIWIADFFAEELEPA